MSSDMMHESNKAHIVSRLVCVRVAGNGRGDCVSTCKGGGGGSLRFESVDEILTSVTIQMKVSERYFSMVLFIMLYKRGSNFCVCR